MNVSHTGVLLAEDRIDIDEGGCALDARHRLEIGLLRKICGYNDPARLISPSGLKGEGSELGTVDPRAPTNAIKEGEEAEGRGGAAPL